MKNTQEIKQIFKHSDEEKFSNIWELIEELLLYVKEVDEDVYHKHMKELHEIYYGEHFTEEFAEMQVEKMHSLDHKSKVQNGECWTLEETNEVYRNHKSLLSSQEINQYDFYVAMNASYHDFYKVCYEKDPENYEHDIIKLAIAYWVCDEDYGPNKIWHLLSFKSSK